MKPSLNVDIRPNNVHRPAPKSARHAPLPSLTSPRPVQRHPQTTRGKRPRTRSVSQPATPRVSPRVPKYDLQAVYGVAKKPQASSSHKSLPVVHARRPSASASPPLGVAQSAALQKNLEDAVKRLAAAKHIVEACALAVQGPGAVGLPLGTVGEVPPGGDAAGSDTSYSSVFEVDDEEADVTTSERSGSRATPALDVDSAEGRHAANRSAKLAAAVDALAEARAAVADADAAHRTLFSTPTPRGGRVHLGLRGPTASQPAMSIGGASPDGTPVFRASSVSGMTTDGGSSTTMLTSPSSNGRRLPALRPSASSEVPPNPLSSGSAPKSPAFTFRRSSIEGASALVAPGAGSRSVSPVPLLPPSPAAAATRSVSVPAPARGRGRVPSRPLGMPRGRGRARAPVGRGGRRGRASPSTSVWVPNMQHVVAFVAAVDTASAMAAALAAAVAGYKGVVTPTAPLPAEGLPSPPASPRPVEPHHPDAAPRTQALTDRLAALAQAFDALHPDPTLVPALRGCLAKTRAKVGAATVAPTGTALDAAEAAMEKCEASVTQVRVLGRLAASQAVVSRQVDILVHRLHGARDLRDAAMAQVVATLDSDDSSAEVAVQGLAVATQHTSSLERTVQLVAGMLPLTARQSAASVRVHQLAALPLVATSGGVLEDLASACAAAATHAESVRVAVSHSVTGGGDPRQPAVFLSDYEGAVSSLEARTADLAAAVELWPGLEKVSSRIQALRSKAQSGALASSGGTRGNAKHMWAAVRGAVASAEKAFAAALHMVRHGSSAAAPMRPSGGAPTGRGARRRSTLASSVPAPASPASTIMQPLVAAVTRAEDELNQVSPSRASDDLAALRREVHEYGTRLAVVIAAVTRAGGAPHVNGVDLKSRLASCVTAVRYAHAATMSSHTSGVRNRLNTTRQLVYGASIELQVLEEGHAAMVASMAGGGASHPQAFQPKDDVVPSHNAMGSWLHRLVADATRPSPPAPEAVTPAPTQATVLGMSTPSSGRHFPVDLQHALHRPATVEDKYLSPHRPLLASSPLRAVQAADVESPSRTGREVSIGGDRRRQVSDAPTRSRSGMSLSSFHPYAAGPPRGHRRHRRLERPAPPSLSPSSGSSSRTRSRHRRRRSKHRQRSRPSDLYSDSASTSSYWTELQGPAARRSPADSLRRRHMVSRYSRHRRRGRRPRRYSSSSSSSPFSSLVDDGPTSRPLSQFTASVAGDIAGRSNSTVALVRHRSLALRRNRSQSEQSPHSPRRRPLSSTSSLSQRVGRSSGSRGDHRASRSRRRRRRRGPPSPLPAPGVVTTVTTVALDDAVDP